jgi:hypothetical protein
MAIGVKFTRNQFDLPSFAAEAFTHYTLMPPGAKVLAAEFAFDDAVTVTLTDDIVTAGSNKTLTPIAPLTGPLPAGTILDFGDGKFATLTSAVAKGAETITGVTLAADTEGDESATYPGGGGRRIVPAGTLVGRTYAERDDGIGYGLADVDADDQIFLVAFEVPDAVELDDIVLVRHRTKIYENKLPGWDDLSADAQAKIRELYDCIKAVH